MVRVSVGDEGVRHHFPNNGDWCQAPLVDICPPGVDSGA